MNTITEKKITEIKAFRERMMELLEKERVWQFLLDIHERTLTPIKSSELFKVKEYPKGLRFLYCLSNNYNHPFLIENAIIKYASRYDSNLNRGRLIVTNLSAVPTMELIESLLVKMKCCRESALKTSCAKHL